MADGNDWRHLFQDSKIRYVFILAVLVRIIILAYLSFHPGGIFAKGDSKDYHELANNLIDCHSFSRDASPHEGRPELPLPSLSNSADSNNGNLVPEPYRTPVYPAFLALIYVLGGNPLVAVAVQSLMGLLIIWLTMLLALRLFEAPAVRMVCVMAAVNPLSLIYDHQLMSDTLFVLLILGGTYIFVRLLQDDCAVSTGSGWPVLGGVLTGLAILTRPVGAYFPALLVILAVVECCFIRRRLDAAAQPLDAGVSAGVGLPGVRVKSLAAKLFVFLLVTGLMVSGWVIRNHAIFGRSFLSTAADHNLLITITSQIVAKVKSPDGSIPTWQVRIDLEKELIEQMIREGRDVSLEPERAAYFRDWSIGVIKAHPGLFVLYYLKGAACLFLADITSLYELVGFTREAQGGWGIVFKSGLEAALLKYFGPQWPLWVAAALPLVLYDLGLYLLALWGGIRLWCDRDYFLLFFFLAMLGYWTAVSAIGTMPRYRYPMIPLLICLAAGNLGRKKPLMVS